MKDLMAPKNDLTFVTCVAPVNIAVIKYWGKQDETNNLPLNSSLSVTLNVNDLCSKTTIAVSKNFKEDCIWLNKKKQDILASKRLQRVLKEARKHSRKRKHDAEESEEKMLRCHISSSNNFPTAAGLASSASGYACMAKCLGEVYDVDIDLSILARLGSGSACRSMAGGFVKWEKGSCAYGSDSKAVQIAPECHWPDLKILILVVSDKQKSVPSTEAMRRSVQTSQLLQSRVSHIVPQRIMEMEKAISEHDFKKFAEITMKESNQLHAICQDTYPPIVPPYMNETSHSIVQLITTLNESAVKAAYTFDAGANAVIFTLDAYFEEVFGTVLKYFPRVGGDKIEEDQYVNVKEEIIRRCLGKAASVVGCTIRPGALNNIISTTPGPGAHVVDNTSSLLDEKGELCSNF